MLQYLVRVHCCGSRWIVYVPAVDAWSRAGAKCEIRTVARQLISSRMKVPASSIGLDLREGHVYLTEAEFVQELSAQRLAASVGHCG